MSVVEDSAASVGGQRQNSIGPSTSTGESATRAPSHPGVVRRRLPDERRAINHHFSVGGQEGYLTVGMYEDGSPGEIFVRMAKEGSTVSGLVDGFATVTSLALQYGVPLKVLCAKLSHMRFEPSGWTGNPKIGFAKSIMDYIARWLAIKFPEGEQRELLASVSETTALSPRSTHGNAGMTEFVQLGDSPTCNNCGGLMVRSGSCHRCTNCGGTSGCS